MRMVYGGGGRGCSGESGLKLHLTVWYHHFSEAIPTVDELELSTPRSWEGKAA